MSDNLEAGDVVELKSGGPQMTVKRIESKGVVCEWFSGSERQSGTFAANTLKRVHGSDEWPTIRSLR